MHMVGRSKRYLGIGTAAAMLAAYGSLLIAHTSGEMRSQLESDGGRARNVILLIGDGMGDSEITVARNYHLGAAGRLVLDTLPFTGAYTTFSVQEANPSLPDYVPDSAATGTAWATGSKTSNGRISTTAGSDIDLPTILELAQRAGLRTGDVSTAELTDATPAVLASHVRARGCQGPANMAACPQDKKSAGGPGSIAEQLVDHHVDVLLGGGRQRFDQIIDGGPDAGRTVTQSAMRQGYVVAKTAAELDALAPGSPVLGLFTPGNMTLEWTGQLAMPYPGTGPQVCSENQRPANEPALAQMTRKAIELLDAAPDRSGRGRGPGFFLQVEGASIDKQDHVENPCAQIGETTAFDAAVKVALDYAREHRDTLVIVTADHAHTSQIIPQPTATDHSPGAFSTLVTHDNALMTVNYATNLHGRSQEHTGSQLRIAAFGPRGGAIGGVLDQTDLFGIMLSALGLD